MQTFFGKHLEKNPPTQSEIYELKICKLRSLPYRAVEDHQITALLRAHKAHLYHKIIDIPTSLLMNTFMRFTTKKPFDCFVMVNVPAFVVVWFYKPRVKKIFIKIPIEAFLTERAKGERKSITEERALAIGTTIEIS